MDTEKFAGNHFHANEAKQHSQSVSQQPEFIGYTAKQEEKRTQAHNGEYVREINNKGVGGDGEDGWYRVDRKDDVAELNDQQH